MDGILLLPPPETPDEFWERIIREGDGVRARAAEIAAAFDGKPIVLTVESGKRGVLIHRSSKRPGRFQVTWWDDRGFTGDTNFSTIEKAVYDSMCDGYRHLNPEAFYRISRTLRFRAFPKAFNIYRSYYWEKESDPSGPVIQLAA